MMANDSLIDVNQTEIVIHLRDSKSYKHLEHCIISSEIIQDCSTYNPCGRYGYCEDNLEGEWTCECKFWWNGTLCDTCEFH